MKGCHEMCWFIREWRRVLVGLMPVGLVLVSCTSATSAPSNEHVATPSNESVGALTIPVMDLTINMDVTDDGFQPPAVFIPVGSRVKLVLRNRGTTEHHYRVVGLVPKDLQWLAGPEEAREEAVTDKEHELHHATGYMPFRGASPAGIRPMGDEVHGYAARDDFDVVLFIPTNTGTFVVQCPLHSEMVGKVTVF